MKLLVERAGSDVQQLLCAIVTVTKKEVRCPFADREKQPLPFEMKGGNDEDLDKLKKAGFQIDKA